MPACLCGLGDTLAKDLDLDVPEGRMQSDRHVGEKLTRAGRSLRLSPRGRGPVGASEKSS